MNLRDCAHGGPGIAGGGFLIDGDGRREPLYGVHIRLVHAPQELAGIGGEALHIPPLPFRIDGVESKAGLTGAGEPGHYNEAVTRETKGDVLEIVLPGAGNDDLICAHKMNSTTVVNCGPEPTHKTREA